MVLSTLSTRSRHMPTNGALDGLPPLRAVAARTLCRLQRKPGKFALTAIVAFTFLSSINKRHITTAYARIQPENGNLAKEIAGFSIRVSYRQAPRRADAGYRCFAPL
jgi:hypothetical protein